jgi:hypothetical protein
VARRDLPVAAVGQLSGPGHNSCKRGIKMGDCEAIDIDGYRRCNRGSPLMLILQEHRAEYRSFGRALQMVGEKFQKNLPLPLWIGHILV